MNRIIQPGARDSVAAGGQRDWRAFQGPRDWRALPDGVLRGIDALPDALTIGGVTKLPVLKYLGNNADLTKIKASYGDDIPAIEAGAAVTLAQDLDIVNGVGRGVAFNGGDHYAFTSGATFPGTDDFIIEMVFKAGTAAVAAEKNAFGSYNVYSSSGGFAIYKQYSTNNYRLLVNDGVGAQDVSLGAVVPGTVYHVMVFCDRSGNAQGYFNGSAVGGCDISAVAGDLNASGYLSIGGGGVGWFGTSDDYTLGVLTAWRGSGWLDTHLQGDIVGSRYRTIFGA